MRFKSGNEFQFRKFENKSIPGLSSLLSNYYKFTTISIVSFLNCAHCAML